MRLYLDLKAAALNPWINKKNLLPGQNIGIETEKAIRKSDYFIALLSTSSVHARSNVHSEIRTAVDVRNQLAGSPVFFIPARLDGVEIPYTELNEIQYVDLFPEWEDGLERILQAMNVNPEQIKLTIERQRNTSPYNALSISTVPQQTNNIPQATPSQLLTFKGEKQFFIGRQVYINQLIKDKLSVIGSKVSIVGPGGSGKSQLAFKAIREYLDKDLFDLVISVYFDEGLITFEKFLLEIAKGLGIKQDDFELNTTIEQRIEIIKKQISNRKHVLLYLDNFETISLIVNNVVQVKSAEEKAQAIRITDFLNNVVPSNNTSILLTSREKNNNLVNEKMINLAGLSQDESMTLFKAFVRDQYLKDLSEQKTRKQVEELLKKTGGHPLSIEIIAKNIRSLYDLEKLSLDLGSLKEDPTQADERFKTLRACFGYTIDKLNDKLQNLLHKLTLFSSPFSISAAVEIFDVTENEILDLYDRSLLTIINSDEIYGNVRDPNYWLYSFHPAVRNYIQDLIKEKKRGYTDDLKVKYGKKFSEYYLNLIGSTYYSIGKDNHVSSLARFNIINQGKDNDFEKAIQLATDRQYSAYILSCLGLISSEIGMYAKSLDYYKRSISIYKELNDRVGMAADYGNIGNVLFNMGNYKEALDYHNKALEIDTELNDRVGMGKDYGNIGNVLSNIGNYKEALDYHNKALEIDTELNNRVGMARDYNNIGLVLSDMGNYKEALDYHNKALEIHTELNDRVGMAADYGNIGNVLFNIGNYKEALDYYNKALEIRTELNDRVGMAADYNNIGLVLRNMSNNKEALDYHNKALEIHTELNDRVGMAADYNNIGFVLYNIGNYKEALDYHNKALEIDTELNDRVGMAKDYNNIGLVLYNIGNYKEALDYHNKALEIDTELNDRVGMAKDYNNIGLVLFNMGNYKEALDYHNKALEIHKMMNDKVWVARDLYNMSFVYPNMNRAQDALDCLHKALGKLEEFKKETNYHHPLLDEVNKQILLLKKMIQDV